MSMCVCGSYQAMSIIQYEAGDYECILLAMSDVTISSHRISYELNSFSACDADDANFSQFGSRIYGKSWAGSQYNKNPEALPVDRDC